MNARTLLIPRTLLILSLVVLSGAPCASAQSFKERLKNAAKKIEQKVKQEVAPKKLPEKSGNTSSLDSELQKRHDAMVGPDNNKNAEDEAPTVRLPETHTALFDPIPCRGNVWDQIGKAGDAAERGIRSGELE